MQFFNKDSFAYQYHDDLVVNYSCQSYRLMSKRSIIGTRPVLLFLNPELAEPFR